MENIKLLEDFNEQVKFLTHKANTLIELIKELYPQDKDLLLIRENIDKLNENIFKIIVVGEFKRGKSTFINALIGEKLLPMGITPTTASVNVLRYSDNPKAILKYKNETEKEIKIDELNFFATTKNTDFNKLSLIEVYYPTALGKEKVEIIDSPGVNDIDEQRVEITYDYIPKCDAAIFLLSATQQLSSSERDFINNKINKYINKIFFILNKVDQLNENEKKEALNYVKNEIAHVSTTNKIFPVSSKLALKSISNSNKEDLVASGLEEFQKELFTFLLKEKGTVLINNSLNKVRNSILKFYNNLKVRISAMEQSMESFIENVNKSKIEFDLINKEKNLIDDFITNKKNKVIKTITEDLTFTFSAFLPKIDTKLKELVSENAEEIEKQLTSYLKQLINDWNNKIEEFVKIEIESLDKFIKEKNTKIYELIEKIQTNFTASTNFEIELNKNSQETNDFMKNIPEFILEEKNTTSKIARGAIFTIGAAILTGGAIIPALILGGIATFLSDIFLKSWNEEKKHTQIFNAIKEGLEKNTPVFKEKIESNLTEFFELNIRKSIMEEIDSSIHSLQNTIDELIKQKKAKENENSNYKEQYTKYIDNLVSLETDLNNTFNK